MAKQKKEQTFEENISQVEEIIESLNNENLPLQKAMTLHAEALELIKKCEDYLQKTTLEFETLQS